ncbi:unnamed protein product [Rhizophagus irregularis]|nr:unnamed protein product [Rhizophagus irregularis]
MNGNQDSFISTNRVVFRRTENNKLRGSGGFLKIRKRRTKIRKFRVGLQSSDKAEPRFVSGGFPKSEKRRSRFVVLPGQSFEE